MKLKIVILAPESSDANSDGIWFELLAYKIINRCTVIDTT
jgi:hypothetical protein